MKKIIILTMSAIVFAACNSKTETAQPKENVSETPQTKEVVYTCPMHPEVVGQKGEKCPKCGMALVEKK
jgi:hypothetical protein